VRAGDLQAGRRAGHPLLASGGVKPDFWEPPAELLERHDGPAFGYDDLLDLHLLLEADDFWSRLEAASAGPQQ
jgi:hypothetical protein